MFCSNCGAKLPDGARFCNKCGSSIQQNNSVDNNPIGLNNNINNEEMISDKSQSTTIVLCITLGVFGGHRFYTKKIGTAIAQCALSIIGFISYLSIDAITIKYFGNAYSWLLNFDYDELDSVNDVFDSYGSLYGGLFSYTAILSILQYLCRICFGAIIIWVIVDLIMILSNKFKDGSGRFVIK